MPAWDGAGERTPPACGCSWPERCKQSALRWQAGRGRRTQVWASAGRLEARQTALRAAKTQNPRGETRWHCPRSWLCRPTATSVRPQTRWASPVSASHCVAAAGVVHRAEPATTDPPHRDACAWTGCLIGLLLLHAASCLRAASSCNANRHGGPELEPVSSGPVSPVGDPGASICASLSRDRVLHQLRLRDVNVLTLGVLACSQDGDTSLLIVTVQPQRGDLLPRCHGDRHGRRVSTASRRPRL